MKLIKLSCNDTDQTTVFPAIIDLVEGGVEIFRLFWYDCRPNLAKTAWRRDVYCVQIDPTVA